MSNITQRRSNYLPTHLLSNLNVHPRDNHENKLVNENQIRELGNGKVCMLPPPPLVTGQPCNTIHPKREGAFVNKLDGFSGSDVRLRSNNQRDMKGQAILLLVV